MKSLVTTTETASESIQRGISPFVMALRLMKKLEAFPKLRWSMCASTTTQGRTESNVLLDSGVNTAIRAPSTQEPEKYVDSMEFEMMENKETENDTASVKDLTQKGSAEKIHTIGILKK